MSRKGAWTSHCMERRLIRGFNYGLCAGLISTVGYALIQGWNQAAIKKVDTCGVLHLHGLPGLFGGLVAMLLVDGISMGNQFKGIVITAVLAILAGLAAGKILSFVGRRNIPYLDAEELAVD